MRPRIIDYLNEVFGTQIFGHLVPTPGLIYPLAMLVVFLVYLRRVRHDNLSVYHGLGAAIWGMVGGIVGARLLPVVLRLNLVAEDPSILWDLGGSTMSWGAYFGGGAGFALYFARHRQPLAPYGDVVGSVFGLGPFIGRFACFLNGDDFGAVSAAPWAVTYPPGSYPLAAHIKLGLLGPGEFQSLPVHPVQLYLAANGLALFLLFSWVWRRKRYRPGTLLFLYWAAYSAARFGMEFFRGDLDRMFVGGFPDAQVIALLICLASIAATIVVYRRSSLPRHDSLTSPPVSQRD